MPVISDGLAMAAAIYDLFFYLGFLGFFFCGSGPVGSLVLCRILLVRFFFSTCSYSCVPSEVFYVKCDYFNTRI